MLEIWLLQVHHQEMLHSPSLGWVIPEILENGQKSPGSEYEAHFNSQSKEASGSRSTPMDTDMPPLTTEDYMDTENTIVEYALNDVFGDLN